MRMVARCGGSRSASGTARDRQRKRRARYAVSDLQNVDSWKGAVTIGQQLASEHPYLFWGVLGFSGLLLWEWLVEEHPATLTFLAGAAACVLLGAGQIGLGLALGLLAILGLIVEVAKMPGRKLEEINEKLDKRA
jgi:hypothetical protein